MSTLLFEEVRRSVIQPSPVVERPTSLEEYPLFGLRLWTGRLLKPPCVELAKRHLATRAPSGVPWKALWGNVQQRTDWFDTYWAVRLPRPSRSLPARAIVFHAQPLSTQIPGTVRQVIREAWFEAEQAYPHAPFTHLEPMYERTRAGRRRLLTPARLAERIASQRRAHWYSAVLCGRVLRLRMHLEETLARWEAEILTRSLRRQALSDPRLPFAVRARRAVAITLGLMCRDPVIVFDRPDWIQDDAVPGIMPLALVAHWD